MPTSLLAFHGGRFRCKLQLKTAIVGAGVLAHVPINGGPCHAPREEAAQLRTHRRAVDAREELVADVKDALACGG